MRVARAGREGVMSFEWMDSYGGAKEGTRRLQRAGNGEEVRSGLAVQ